MISDVSLFTLEAVCRLGLPLDTQVLASGGELTRPVRWVVATSAGILPYLEGGELVLVVPGEGELQAIIAACAEAGAAAVACLPPVPPLALAAAEATGTPLLQLPAGSRIREVERSVLGLLMDRREQSERHSAQIYDQLVQLVSENAGLDKLISALAQATNKAVVLQDKHLRIKGYAVSPVLADQWEAVTELVKDRATLPDRLSDRHRLPHHAAPGVLQTLHPNGLTRLIAPIVTRNVGRGFLTFLAPAPQAFDEVDMLVIGHGATVCALEMARDKQISNIQKQLRGDFLTSLMQGTITEAEVQAETDRFGHDMSAPHVVMVLKWYGAKRPSNRRLETLVNSILSGVSGNASLTGSSKGGKAGRPNGGELTRATHTNTLTQLREDEMRLFFAPDGGDPLLSARQFAGQIYKEAKHEHPHARLAIGIGSVAYRVWDWRASYREAANAAEIARRLRADEPKYSGDLGVYTLLARPDYREDLLALRDKTIGSLLKSEERLRTDLLDTLEAFFQCHGNYTQTAELLSVHRNTLFYRMNRIAEITGLELDQPDVRLAVHLSLKIHRLMGIDGER